MIGIRSGTFDVNSKNGPILPWLRSIDALNTHDDAFELAIAGGVTSAQVLPGSGNAIGESCCVTYRFSLKTDGLQVAKRS